MAKISKKSTLLFADGKSGEEAPGGASDGGTVETITHIPNVDMYSTQDELVIEVEIPGVRREDVELYLHKNMLRISAVKHDAPEESRVNYVCMERVFGRLYRSIELPFPVNTSKIKAVCRNGILTITAPRIHEDKRAAIKSIPVGSK